MTYIHGLNRTRFQKIWAGIQERCNVENNKDYFRYGGRGIKCEWENLLEFKIDMRVSYLTHCKKYGKVNTQIDRINVNKNYNKKNCRWVTIKEQGRNRRTNKMLTFKGKTQCISAWGEELKMCRKVIAYRIRSGWGTKNALTIKIDHGNVWNKVLQTSRKIIKR